MSNEPSDNAPATIKVEVAYALPDKQSLLALDVPAGTTAMQAAGQSALAQQYDELIVADAKLGIFGKVVAPTQVLREGDRVEIYRPLIADPKEVRKARAARAKERRSESDSKS
ncbi:MAG: RnfH family protein [Halioglobus sp.]